MWREDVATRDERKRFDDALAIPACVPRNQRATNRRELGNFIYFCKCLIKFVNCLSNALSEEGS